MATDGKPNISAQLVKELRDRTGAGFAACREALMEARRRHRAGHRHSAQEGQAAAAKKAQRATSEGLVELATFMPAGRSACWWK